MSILITGGLGYIGSHIAKISRSKIIILDNKSNSKLNYKLAIPKARVYLGKVTKNNLKKIFQENSISSVLHLAGLKSVKESTTNPILYYKENITSTIDLLETMSQFNINRLIFSSSATVYGNQISPLKESNALAPIHPYGETKAIIEKLIEYHSKCNNNFSYTNLRYFNPIGAHESGLLSDNPLGEPQNLIPVLIKSIKRNKTFYIFGKNYETYDGTCIRDYIHVSDLAQAHLICLKLINKSCKNKNINIGLGQGISVLEIINIFERTIGIKIKYKYASKRSGDIDKCFADNTLSKKLMNWTPKLSYEQMCRDAWFAAKKY